MWASHRVFLVSLEMIMGVADDKWRSATFDSTGSHIIVAGDRGFRVASSLGHAIIDERPELGPCDQISQCGASNLFVISKSEPSYRCLLFDDSRRRVIGELGPFESRPVGLRWIDDAGIIVVQLEAGEVLAYNVMDELRLVRRGPCAEPATAGTLAAVNLGGVARVAHAGKERGSVVVAEIPRTACPEGAAPMPVTTAIGQNDKHQAAIRAHNRDIASVALSHDGLRVATASSKGTVIRFTTSRWGVLRCRHSLWISNYGGALQGRRACMHWRFHSTLPRHFWLVRVTLERFTCSASPEGRLSHSAGPSGDTCCRERIVAPSRSIPGPRYLC